MAKIVICAICEILFIFIAWLMLKLPTVRGTKTELIHSQIFDKAVILALMFPVITGIYKLYRMSGYMIFLVLSVLFCIFTCCLLIYDARKVTEMHKQNIEREKKKSAVKESRKDTLAVKPVSLPEVQAELEKKQKEKELSGTMSVDEVLHLLDDENRSGETDWNKVAEDALLHQKAF
jgi:uncharacterized membrane protein